MASTLFLSLTLVCQDSRAAAHFQPLRSFGFPSQLGSQPHAPLIKASDGLLYGTTYGAANNFAGTVFKMNLDGSGYTVLYKFKSTDGDGRNPTTKLVEGKDGALYGVTFYGGTFGLGTVFKLNKDGTGYQVLHSFKGSPADGSGPAGLLEASDGALYSTTFLGGDFNLGCIFRLNKDGTGHTNLHSLNGSDGARPNAGLIEASDQLLYGTSTSGGNQGAGAVFRLSKDGGNFAVLYSFSTTGGDGQHPYAALLEGTDGALYGTTYEGGGTNAGTVFKLDKNGSNYIVLRNFIVGPPSPGNPLGQLLEGTDHALYGTSFRGGSDNAGTVFRITRDGLDFNIMHHFKQGDGYWPYAGLIEVGNTLYGTTREGGAARIGTAFRINEDGSGYGLIHHFNFSGYDGYYPLALVQGSDEGIYGVTQTGGTNADGTLFKINPDGSGYTLLHHFDFGTGRVPNGLIQGRDGVLYGTTFQGGTNDGGTLYAINADSSAYTLLHVFGTNSMQGMNPSDAPLEANDGALYGTTHNGGSNSVGTVFRVTKQGDNCAVLHQFASGTGDGYGPYAGLLEGSDLALYGVTYSGGAYQYGTVFRITTNGGAYQILHGFGSGSDGSSPVGGLIKGSDGMLYGTTFFGGAHQCGTVFKIANNGGAYLVLHEFTGTTAYSANPAARLVEGPDGALYGTAWHGGDDNTGMIFKLSKDGSGYTQVHSFAIPPAAYQPDSGLVAARDGALYGSTLYGGDLGLGTLFRLWPAATPDMLFVDLFNGMARVSFAGEANRQYQVLRSTNLTQWESLGIVTMPDPGFVVYPDANPPASAAYYRAYWVR